MQRKTPDVYVQEKSILPPSVAEVATAIPVFVGYTELVEDAKKESIVNRAIRIRSMADFKRIFGGPYKEKFTVDGMGNLVKPAPDGSDNAKITPDYILYQSVQHFFANGGGGCYIVSVGKFPANPAARKKSDFSTALKAISLIDEITLIVLSDAVNLGAVNYYSLIQEAISQCNKLMDRFTIVDVIATTDAERTEAKTDSDIGVMRAKVPGDKYAASYYPYLKTVMPREYSDSDVTVKYKVKETDKDGKETEKEVSAKLSDLKSSNTAMYFQVQAELKKNYLVLPPSAAVVGIYAKTDGNRGVWKAPANVMVSAVLGPITAIDNDMQQDMNVDSTAGKSVNAIRSFTGKGTLVWGARTLAGNDNEWRYVSVRRLFNMVEESVKKATHFAVFEPNTPFTWLKLKTMIESYLESLWRQGAFFGDSPAQAFFVNVGLGQTMTEDDINNGIMNIEIGLAAVRPAEFIILTFSHKRLEG